MTTHPEFLSKVASHGFSIGQEFRELMLERYLTQRKLLEDLYQEYPEARQIVRELRVKLPKNLCFNNGDFKVCGSEIMDSLGTWLGFHDYWGFMIMRLRTLNKYTSAQDFTSKSTYLRSKSRQTLHTFLKTVVFAAPNVHLSTVATVDTSQANTLRDDAFGSYWVEEQLINMGLNPESWELSELRYLAQPRVYDDFIAKNVSAADPLELSDLKLKLERNPHIQFYIFSGKQDPLVSVKTHQLEAQELGDLVNFEIFPNTGHEGIYVEPRIQEVLLD